MVWRAFVYNCFQDWRDRSTDRARAAYDTFLPLDGAFADNVIVQVKLGPMDFQVREPASPLLLALRETSAAIEVQITQEYTGQQKDLCFLHPQWHEVMSTAGGASDGQADDAGRIVSGHETGRALGGVTGVANVGDDPSWTGHVLAQANLYAFGRLAWDPAIDPAAVAAEWVTQTFGPAEPVFSTVTGMLLDSWRVYESYTAPLGVGLDGHPAQPLRPQHRRLRVLALGHVPLRRPRRHRGGPHGADRDRVHRAVRADPGPACTRTSPAARTNCCSSSITCRTHTG